MKYILLALLVLVASCAASDTELSEPDIEGSLPEASNPEPHIVFSLEGDNFNFYRDGVVQPELRVKEGYLVRVEFESIGGYHDWVVDEFNAATEKVQEGGTTYVEFIADTKGTFEYYCSVGSHRANGMVGTLVVE